MSDTINHVITGDLFTAGAVVGTSLLILLLVAVINILIFAAILMVVWNWSMKISHPNDTDVQAEKRKMPYITSIGIILLLSFILSFFRRSNH